MPPRNSFAVSASPKIRNPRIAAKKSSRERITVPMFTSKCWNPKSRRWFKISCRTANAITAINCRSAKKSQASAHPISHLGKHINEYRPCWPSIYYLGACTSALVGNLRPCAFTKYTIAQRAVSSEIVSSDACTTSCQAAGIRPPVISGK